VNYRVNLLPVELQPGPVLEPKRLLLISLVTLTAGGLVAACVFWSINFYYMRIELAAIKWQVPKLQETVAQLEEIKKQRQELEAASGELERLIQQRHTWTEMFLDLNKVVPREVWLTALRLQAAENVSGAGQKVAGPAAAQKPGSVPSLLQSSLQQAGRVAGEVLQQVSAQTGVPANQSGETGQPGQAGSQDMREDGNAIPRLPDTLTLEGNTTSLAAVGVFIYQLGKLPYFSRVDLNEVKYDETKGVTTFSISARLKGVGGG